MTDYRQALLDYANALLALADDPNMTAQAKVDEIRRAAQETLDQLKSEK